MFCISIGQLNSSARHEITQAVVHQMMNHCKYPTSKQIDVIASKIVETIKGSKDCLGVGHVSYNASYIHVVQVTHTLP